MSLSSLSHLKLYGVPLSQPFRSVAWLLLQQHVHFEAVLTVPGMKNKMGSLHEEFRNKTKGRTGQVPVLEIKENNNNNTPLCISESPAIMTHVCERLMYKQEQSNNNNWYAPPATPRKALIDSYMSWHHRGTRELAALARPLLRPDLKEVSDDDNEKLHQGARKILEQLDTGWLQGGGDDVYIAGDGCPSIADLLCYEEVVQCSMTGLLPFVDDYPNVVIWMNSMREMPFHKEIHASLVELGDLSSSSSSTTPNNEKDIPMSKRLGNATKVGMQAIKDAQATYST